MFEQFASVAFTFTTLSLSLSEVKRYNNLITPFTVSALPILVIILFINFGFIYVGVEAVTLRVHIFLLLCVFCIWLVGWFFSKNGITKIFNKEQFSVEIQTLDKYKWFLSILGILISLIAFWRIYSVTQAHGGWLYIASQKFENEMVQGPIAHLITLGQAIFVLLFVISLKAKSKLIIRIALVLLGISVFSMMVKYHLLWIIMIIFLIRNLDRDKNKQFKSVIRISLVLSFVLVFYFIFLSFFWKTFSFSNVELWEFFYKTFLNYFMSSPIVLDRWLDLPAIKPDWSLFVVFENLINTLLGNPIRFDALPLVSTGFYNIGADLVSNVGTSFGVYYLIGGLPFTILITVLFAMLSYYFYTKRMKSGSIYLHFITWFLLVINTLNFFVQYFTLLSFYEFPILFLTLVFVLKFINKYYHNHKIANSQ